MDIYLIDLVTQSSFTEIAALLVLAAAMGFVGLLNWGLLFYSFLLASNWM